MSDGRFDAFVLFAGMRTGSNYLEASLNDLPDVTSYGEVFNPTFIGDHKTHELLGYDMDRREKDPLGLLDAIISATDGIAGFRMFHDHDPRVTERVLPDPRIAKIILTRNPLESYVSRRIAAATGQWRLNDLKHHRSARIVFQEDKFAEMLDQLQDFQLRLQRGLQITGQTAFHIRYEDVGDADVLNGIAAFLGSDHRIDRATTQLKKQNPGNLEEKVENYDAMVAALRRLDRFGLDTTPIFEPPRRAGVPGFIVHPEAALIYIPIKGGPEQEVIDWMALIGNVGSEALITRLTQKKLRQWMRAHPGFRSFAVLRHPVARAYDVFSRYILPTDLPDYAVPRAAMRKRYGLAIPETSTTEPLDTKAQRVAFLTFLTFLKGNLAGQTSIRIDNAWATQTAILQGVASFVLPHHLIREEDMSVALPRLAAEAGVADAPAPAPAEPPDAAPLKAVYDGDIEKAAMDAYRRDYLSFGFPRWNRR